MFFVGLLLIGNSNIFGKLLGDAKAEVFSFNDTTLAFSEYTDIDISQNKIENYFWTVFFIITGTILVDFATDTLLNPSRAYVLDVCVVGNYLMYS